MKRIIYSAILLACLSLQANAQDGFQQILSEIEINNITLKALREKAKADKIGNKTGINLENPEVEFGYAWGNAKSEGNKSDLSISQSFDFPTAYRYKSQLTDGLNLQVDMAYEQQAREIIQQARVLCVELVYQTKINKQLTERRVQAKELAEAYQNRFDKGDIDIIEYNKTKLNLLNTEKALQMNEVEMNTLRAELQRLNGGQPAPQLLEHYTIYSLPLNFELWFETAKGQNPALQLAEKEVELSRKQEQLTRALNLPKFSAGYTSERSGGGIQQGFSVGMSIPLWEGRNTVKHQKAQTVALQIQQEDSKIQFHNSLKNQYDRAKRLSILLNDYTEKLNITNDQALLQKAFDKGQLSLINYLLELTSYYETLDQYLETEKEYQLAASELQQWDK